MVGLCRLCASLRKMSVLTTIKDNSEICEKLRHCCQLDIKVQDALPKSICQECLDNLNKSHKFYLKVKEAQETLETLYPTISAREENEKDTEENQATLVETSIVAEKNHRRIKYSELLNQFVNSKVETCKESEKSNVPDDENNVQSIKLENVRSLVTKDFKKDSSNQKVIQFEKEQTSETLNYLEEVYNILEMTKEEVLENSYEILDAIDENENEIVEDEDESEHAHYVSYENDSKEQEPLAHEVNGLLEENYSDNLEDTLNVKVSSIEPVSKELSIEMEYMEDEEYDDEMSSIVDTENNKIDNIKTLTLLPPELQFTSWKSYSYLCFICNLKMLSFIDLKKHIANKHSIIQSDKLQYKCYDCQKIIPRYNYFLNHIRSKHHPALKLRCEACDLQCQNFEELSNHRSVNCAEAKNYENLLPCNQCFKSFHNTFGLQNHCKFQHTTTKVKVKYQCLQCGKQFQYKNCLKVHERLHTDRKTFSCGICHRTFSNKISMEQHLYVHVADKMYKCNICNKSYKTFITLDQHQAIHNDEKPFKCEYCPKYFRKKVEKLTHERTHTGEMPFQCEQCDKRFRFRSAYNAHSKIHSGIKPYSCEYCDKAFADSSNRNKHVRRKHLNYQNN